MSGAVALGRRALLALTGITLAEAVRAAPADLSYSLSKTAPPPRRIERLLVWLPPDDKAVDSAGFATALSTALASYGTVVQIGRAKPLELDRATDQAPLAASFKPTHRLEIGTSSGSISSGLSRREWAVVKLVLYQGEAKTVSALFTFSAAGRQISEMAGVLVGKLKLEHYL